MKKLVILFVFALLALTVQSQSLTEKELTGTWQVVSVENPTSNPKAAQEMDRAYFNLNGDKSFSLRTRKDNTQQSEYETSSAKNAQWSYNTATQTIQIPRTKMTLKVSGSGDTVFFTVQETGLRLQMTKPI